MDVQKKKTACMYVRVAAKETTSKSKSTRASESTSAFRSSSLLLRLLSLSGASFVVLVCVSVHLAYVLLLSLLMPVLPTRCSSSFVLHYHPSCPLPCCLALLSTISLPCTRTPN